MEQTLEKTK